MEIGDLASWVATTVSVVAMVFTIQASRRAKHEQEAAAKHERQAAEIMAKAHGLDQLKWVDQYFYGVREWANEACCLISEAIHYCDSFDKVSERRLHVLSRLSALIDTGRWYFPNQWSDEYGVHKEPAYRGVRQGTLDYLVAAYRHVENGDCERSNLIGLQRMFVSEIQEALDPRQRQKRIETVLKEFEVSEKLRAEV